MNIIRQTRTCSNCGDAMQDTGHRACETCRAYWRESSRKPGGPAEQKVALIELLKTAKDIARILEAARYSHGLGKGQIERLNKAQAAIAKAEGVLRA